MAQDCLQLARDCYGAYVTGDRSIVERRLADVFEFYSRPDPGIDRATYFERSWPSANLIEEVDFKHLIEAGDAVV